MEEIISLANKLGAASFATLLVVILAGSYFKIWVWGRDLVDAEKRHAVEMQKANDETIWWRGVAVRATGIAEVQGQVLRVKEDKELAKIDTVNKRLTGREPS